MRDENKALWREISRLGGRVPSHIANTLSQSTSTSPPKLHIGGDDEDEDGSEEGFSFNVMAPGFSMGMGGGGEAWMNWAGAEMRRERRKVEKLTGIVRTLCDTIGSGAFLPLNLNSSLTLHAVSPTLIQELNALNAPSPSPSPVPPSPIPSDHSPNIYITSAPSPSPSHAHSPSHSHSSQGHGHSHHPSVPMLSIPQYALHTSTPSPTSSEFSAFGRHGHGRQPSITLTPTPDVDAHGMREGGREKRQRRTGSVVSVGSVGSSMGGGSPMVSPMVGGSVSGLGGASMGGEDDVEGDMSLSLDLDMDVGGSGGEKQQQQHQRARSDSAPTWVTGQNAGTSAGGGVGVGGLTANWGRPRSGSGYGR